MPARPAASGDHATAEMFPLGRHKARGVLRFRTTEKGTRLRGRITGLSRGNFGFSIHEKGDCSAHDGKSVGGYFNPRGNQEKPLGLREDLDADASGEVSLNRLEEELALEGPESILGKAVIIHAWPHDPNVDLKTVPFVACGVINPE